MEMLCPECMSTLVTTDGQSARCATHGEDYRILFTRWQPPAPPVIEDPSEVQYTLTPGANCAQHPETPADYACRDCGTPICAVCAFAEADGSQLCPQCMTRRARAGRFNRAGLGMEVTPLPAGVRCVQHPSVSAVRKCQTCGAFMCATCDFELPGGVHVCPACAAAPKTALSPKRKQLLIWSYVMAVWCTLGWVVLLSGALSGMIQTKADETALGLVMSLFLFIPSLVALALGVSALDRRLVNPTTIWVATVWNALLVLAYFLLMIKGAMS